MADDGPTQNVGSGDSGSERTTHYLSSLAVEDLREYDALLLAMVLLLIGLLLSARCSRLLSRLREARTDGSVASASALTVTDEGVRATRRRKNGNKKKTATAASSDEDIDDLAAEEQAFLDNV